MTDTPAPDRVECRPTRDPAVRWFIFAGMLLALGLWCIWDVFVKGKYPYPGEGANLNDHASFYFNNVGAGAFTLVGLVALAMGIRFLRTPLVADAEGIGYAGKPKLPWGDVTELDAASLKDKGILYLRRARGKPLLLDAWKLQDFRQLVMFVEAHVPTGARRTTGRDEPARARDANDEA